jgi:hypothetical protein
MPRIVETAVYEFHELSEKARENARAWFRERLGDDDWYEFILEDFAQIAPVLGVTLTTRPVRLLGGGTRHEPCIYFSGFSSQGDGACFEGTYAYDEHAARRVREHAPRDAELHRIADRLDQVQRANTFGLRAVVRHQGRYYHEYSMDISVERDSANGEDIAGVGEDAVSECLRDLAHRLYRQLEREWEYMMGDAYADERIRTNGYTFTADGRPFG